MILYTDIHFETGRHPNKKDWKYTLSSRIAGLLAIVFFTGYYHQGVFGEFVFLLLQLFTPLLYLYPIYVIGKSLETQWQEKAIYMWDVLLFLFFVAVALLVATGQLYIRQEWLDAFFDRA
ncbi:hypothetical protein [Parabacteroides johnsonii]|uniref:hypothetical protein n=1 Tax=Parabacteroides johnsonii TaxID=387661 RepID=UPI003AB7CF11